MYQIESDAFEQLVRRAIDAIPPRFGDGIQNLAFIVEDLPNDHHRHAAKLTPHQTLFGLYEGVPLTRRGGNYSMVLPDKITIFRVPHMWAADSAESLEQLVNKTVWHEVAHYYGLDHAAIEAIEREHYKASS